MHRYRSSEGFFFLLLLAAAVCSSTPTAAAQPIKAAYWPSYSSSTFPAASIDFSYFTHVLYAFVQADPASFEAVVTPSDAQALPGFVAAAHGSNAKALLSFGGGDAKTTFPSLVSSRPARTSFINSAVAAARTYGLDGLDLDWEYPADVDQMGQLGDLLTEWRTAIDTEAANSGRPKLLLTAAVYFSRSLLSLDSNPRSYPIQILASSLDWINAMCYDYHGSWDTTVTGAPAALYDPKSNISTSYGIDSWISAGFPSEQVVMGMPLYGHTWQLKNPVDNGIGAPAVGIGPGNQKDGTMVYSAIVEFNKKNGATRVYDSSTVSTYSYSGTSWIGYDDPESVTNKVEFAKARGLGGYFFWALGFDDGDWSVSAAVLTNCSTKVHKEDTSSSALAGSI
ncbi:chitinase-3-like protein 1 isoform X1 [Iris pallida]|uniref:Chitinase-3-like protein 1 isoform X1 n=1 Tax=Iris pallida TaxID=29817 RepID=A0AAX6FGG5_IRIPA|nr:chitinase-3-like protein 1 isoform X1 [Iris pallida]